MAGGSGGEGKSERRICSLERFSERRARSAWGAKELLFEFLDLPSGLLQPAPEFGNEGMSLGQIFRESGK